MKKVKALIMLGVIVSTFLIGSMVANCADIDPPNPPKCIVFKY